MQAELSRTPVKSRCYVDSRLLFEAWKRTALRGCYVMWIGDAFAFTPCVERGHDAFRTTYGSCLADWIKIHPQTVLCVFTPELSSVRSQKIHFNARGLWLGAGGT